MFLYGAVQHMFAVPSICSEDLFCERNPPNRRFAYSRSNSSALSEAFETHVQLYNCGFLFAENTLLVLIWAKRLWDIYLKQIVGSLVFPAGYTYNRDALQLRQWTIVKIFNASGAPAGVATGCAES